MPKKAPRFQLANRVVILTFFLSALIVGFYQLTTRGIGVAWMGFIAVLYLLIPPLYRRIFHLKPTYLIDMVLMIFILLAFNLGVALRLYGSIPWYDNAVHGLSGAVFALIGQIQEETHRFAITYHRQLRSKRLRYSELDGIPGIGAKRKQELLRQFKSLSAIGQATLPELERLLPKDAAAAVYHHFREKGEE